MSNRNIVSDKNSNIYLAFSYSDSFEFDTTVIYGLSSTKLAIIKINPDGQKNWIKTTQSNFDGNFESISEISFNDSHIEIRAGLHSESIIDGFTFNAIISQQSALLLMDTNGSVLAADILKLIAAQYAKGLGFSYYQIAYLSQNSLLFVKGWEFKPVANVVNIIIKADTLTFWKSIHSVNHKTIRIFPNPVENHVFINFPTIPDTPAELSIYNSLGNQVYTTHLSQLSNQINIDELPGIYFINIVVGNERYVKKIIIR